MKMPQCVRLRALLGFTRCQRGVTAVEAAFILPAVLLFAFAIIEISLLGFTRAAVEYNAWQAARYAAVHTEGDGRQRAEQRAEQAFGFVVPDKDLTTVSIEKRDGLDVAVAKVATKRDFLVPLGSATTITVVGTAQHYLPGSSGPGGPEDGDDDEDDDEEEDDDDDEDDDEDD